jgi:hypothetical protein
MLYRTPTTNATAVAKCAALNGYIVSYNNAEEQLQVETFFQVNSITSAGRQSQCMAPAPDDDAANGEVLNAYPYAHWQVVQAVAC